MGVDMTTDCSSLAIEIQTLEARIFGLKRLLKTAESLAYRYDADHFIAQLNDKICVLQDQVAELSNKLED